MQNKQLSIPTGLNLELDDFINWNKDSIKHAARMCAASIQEGEADAIDSLIFTKKLGEFAKELDTQIRPLAESSPIGAEFQKFGVKIDERMTGVKYDFSYCQDEEWIRLKFESDVAKNALEEREKFLKAITKPTNIVTEDGEAITLQPPVKSGKVGYAITIL